MPRWLGLETSSLKACCSSFDTVIPDCMVPTLEARSYLVKCWSVYLAKVASAGRERVAINSVKYLRLQ